MQAGKVIGFRVVSQVAKPRGYACAKTICAYTI